MDNRRCADRGFKSSLALSNPCQARVAAEVMPLKVPLGPEWGPLTVKRDVQCALVACSEPSRLKGLNGPLAHMGRPPSIKRDHHDARIEVRRSRRQI